MADALVQTRIDLDLARWLKKLAKSEGVTVAYLVRRMLIEKRAETLPPPSDAPIIRIMRAVEKLAARDTDTERRIDEDRSRRTR